MNDQKPIYRLTVCYTCGNELYVLAASKLPRHYCDGCDPDRTETIHCDRCGIEATVKASQKPYPHLCPQCAEMTDD